jgi:hypothetical protein
MSTRKYSIFDTLLARISHGSVPFDAIYWLDPEAADPVSVVGSDEPGAATRALVGRQLASLECVTCD